MPLRHQSGPERSEPFRALHASPYPRAFPPTSALTLLPLLLLAPSPAHAEPPNQPPTPPQTYRTEVHTPRTHASHLRASTPGAIEVITISGDARGRGIADILSEATGVQIQSFGGLGRYAQVSIRGSSADQVTVYLDGVPITRSAGGAINLADIPLGQLERIEIFRGLPPPWLPGAPAGGAINLVTRTPAGRRRVEAEIGGGSFGARNARVLGQWASDRLTFTSFFEYQGATGDFDFDSDNGTPLNLDDDRSAARKNNGFDELAMHTRAVGRLQGPWRLVIAGGSVVGQRELPQVGHVNGPLDATLQHRRLQVSAEFSKTDAEIHPEADLGSASSDTALGIDLSFAGDRFTDLQGSVGLGERQDTEGRTWSVGARGRRRFRMHRAFTLDAVLSGRVERYVEQAFFPRDLTSDPSDRLSADATLAADWELAPGGSRIAPQLRTTLLRDRFADRPTTNRILISPSLTLRAGKVRATVWRGIRAPAFYELFGDRGPISGNPDLVPETVLGTELGLAGTARWPDHGIRASGEVVGFSKRASNLIQLRQASATASKAFNVGEADLAGLELRGRLNLGRWLDLTANYTFQRAVDAGAAPHTHGRALPRRPDHELFVRPRLRLIADRLTVTPRLSYTSRTFLDAANLLPTPSRTFVGLEVDLQLVAGFALGITAENLLDERTQDFQGYPLPGRSFFASLQWRWVQGP